MLVPPRGARAQQCLLAVHAQQTAANDAQGYTGLVIEPNDFWRLI